MRSSTSSSERLRLVRAWLTAALGFAIAFEASTRIEQALRYGAPLLGAYTYDSELFVRDAYGLHGRPRARFEKWELNSLGMRGPEPREIDEGGLRVACIGASETFGQYESEGGEWPRRLERLLLDAGVGASVVNAALPGMSAPAQLNHFRFRVAPLENDVVVWMIHYESFAGLSERRLAQPPVPDAPVSAWRAALAPRGPAKLSTAVLSKLPPFAQNALERTKIAATLRLRQREAGDRYRSLKLISADERAAFKAVVRGFRDLAQEHGSRLVVAFPPRYFSPRTLDLHYTSFPLVDESWIREAQREFPLAAEREGVEILDLRHALDGRWDDAMRDIVHFSDSGADVIAHAVARQVLSVGSQRATLAGPGHG
jgi:lysophospholipase L1-like esterase